MSAAQRLIGRALGVALAIAAAVACPVAAQTSDGTSDGTAQQVPILTVEPDGGPPGTQVAAKAVGFENCLPVYDDVDPGEVTLRWGRTPLQTLEVHGGAIAATFLVPESASVGATYFVEARCVYDDSLTASATFTVAPPVETPAVVPNLVGMTVDEARAALKEARLELGSVSGTGDAVGDQEPEAGTEVEPGTAVRVGLASEAPALAVVPDLVDTRVSDAADVLTPAGLVLGTVSGDGDVIRTQSPRPGAEVPRETAIDVTVGTPVPQSVVVPNLVDVSLDDAPAVLVSSGLELGQVAGRGDVIHSQTPAPGTEVPSGSSVNVSVELALSPEPLVEVPNLVGDTVDEARAALADVGLALGGDLDGDSAIERQAPAAGTLVPLETTVTATAGTGPLPIAVLAGIVAAALIVVGAALAGVRAARPARKTKWVRRHVRIVVGATADHRVVLRTTRAPTDRSPPTSVVRIEPHADHGIHVLEEVDR